MAASQQEALRGEQRLVELAHERRLADARRPADHDELGVVLVGASERGEQRVALARPPVELAGRLQHERHVGAAELDLAELSVAAQRVADGDQVAA